MGHHPNTKFAWADGTPKWDDDRKRVWLKWWWEDQYHTPHLTEVMDHFEIQIRYTFKNANGGIETQQKEPETMSNYRDGDTHFDYYWEVPSDCLTVEFKIHAIAKTHTENGQSVPWFEDDPWTPATFYCGSALTPDKPSAPTVTHDSHIGTQIIVSLDNVRDSDNNKNVVQVEFQTVTYDSNVSDGVIIQSTAKAKVDEFGNAKALIIIGNKYGYKFRARLLGVKDKDAAGGTIEKQVETCSEWSELTQDMVLGVPERPTITVRKYTEASAEYAIKAKVYNHYQIQTAPILSAFDSFDDWEREYPQFKENGEERTAALQNCGINERSVGAQTGFVNVTPIEAGKVFWRARSCTAQQDGFYSTWSEPFSLTFGEQLRPPIVSMSKTFANIGDSSIQLIIRHNSPNGSPTCRCDIYLRVGGGGSLIPFYTTIRPENMTPGQNNDGSYTYYYNLNLTDLGISEETTVTWYAVTYEGNRASESEATRSNPSEYVTFWVYEKPSLEIVLDTPNVDDEDPEHPHVFSGFPIHFYTQMALGLDKKVVSWNVRISPMISYINTGKHGEKEVVNKGEALYNIIDVLTPDNIDKTIKANEITLDQGPTYKLDVYAALNTGVTVSASALFKMVLPSETFAIEVKSSYNFDNISLGLCPSAVKYEGTGLSAPANFEDSAIVAQKPMIKSYLWNDGENVFYSDGDDFVYNPETKKFDKTREFGGTLTSGQGLFRDSDNNVYDSGNKMLDKTTRHFTTITWTNKPSSFNSNYVWYCVDGNTYYSRSGVYRVLNGQAKSWETKQWYGYLSPSNADCCWNDGVNQYYSNWSSHGVLDPNPEEPYLPYQRWNEKTWNGLTQFYGYHIWKYKGHIYYSYGETQYELDTATDTWIEKTWNGLTSFNGSTVMVIDDDIVKINISNVEYQLDAETDTWNVSPTYMNGVGGLSGYYIWTDGENWYNSYQSYQFKYDPTNERWDVQTWPTTYGYKTPSYGHCVWHHGDNIYYSYSNNQYVLDTEENAWDTKTWNGLTQFNGEKIWIDGEHVYYSDGANQYELDTSTDTWSPVTFTGDLTSFYGQYVWKDGNNIYYSTGNGTFYKLNNGTREWETVIFQGYTSITGNSVWTDGESTYYSFQHTYKLNRDTNAWEMMELEHDITNSSNVWFDGEVARCLLNGVLSTFHPEIDSSTKRILVSNVELAVYRKNDDGTFVTIAENLLNTEAAYVTDPHPNLGGAEYRIVATDMTSGRMTFYDPSPYDMQCTDIILQWDEEYADMPFNDNIRETTRETIRQFGSFVRLPYNIDVSESANIENSMVNYIGRKNPVSYYGTQTGYAATWNTEIPKYDTQTIKMLRRLQVYPGDVYVREPNGTGYWAHVTVTFPINHLALTVSVSLSVTRVEGGM